MELHVAAPELRELLRPAAYAAADRTMDELEMLRRDARAHDLERERVLIVTRNAAHTCLGATRRVGRTSDVCSIPWSWWPGWSGYIAGSPVIGRCSRCGNGDGPTGESPSGSVSRTSRPWTGSHGRRIAPGVSSRIPTDWCPPPGVGRPISNVPPERTTRLSAPGPADRREGMASRGRVAHAVRCGTAHRWHYPNARGGCTHEHRSRRCNWAQ